MPRKSDQNGTKVQNLPVKGPIYLDKSKILLIAQKTEVSYAVMWGFMVPLGPLMTILFYLRILSPI